MSAYENFSNTKLKGEIEALRARIVAAGETVFMRMLHELQVYQMELELQNRELLEAQRELEVTRDRYTDLYDFSPLAYFTFDANGMVHDLNLAGASLLGRGRQGLLGNSFINFIARNERGNFLAYVRDCISGGGNDNVEFALELPDGKAIRVQATGVVAQSENGNCATCRIAFVEVTEHRIAELKLRLTSKVLENTLEGIMLTDAQQRIIAVNPAFLRMTGYDSDEIIGYTPSILKSGHHNDEFYREMNASFKEHDGWQGEIWNKRKNGEIYPEWVNIQVIRKNNGDVDCYIGIFSDASNQEAMKQRLKELAYYDELTGLANRSLLYDRLQLALVHARRSKLSQAVLFIDLDYFKEINDIHGHKVGDEILKQVAGRLAYCVREGDTLSRLGADEFVALMPDIPNLEVSSRIAERMVAALEKAFVLDNLELRVTTSIGISVFPQDGDEVTVLLKNADTAMRRAKKFGRGDYQYYKLHDDSAESMPKL